MKAVKRIEIVIDEVKSDEILDALEAAGIEGYTVLYGASGKGQRGTRSGGDITGVFANAYILIACESTKLAKIVEIVRPVLTQYGGLCLVSDAMSVLH